MLHVYCVALLAHLLPPHHTTPHHTQPHHATPHHTSPNHTTSHHTTPHLTTLNHTTLHHTSPNHTQPHHTTPHSSTCLPLLPFQAVIANDLAAVHSVLDAKTVMSSLCHPLCVCSQCTELVKRFVSRSVLCAPPWAIIWRTNKSLVRGLIRASWEG